MRFIGDTATVGTAGRAVWRHIAGFRVHGRQVNIVGVVLQAGGPGVRFVAFGVSFGVSIVLLVACTVRRGVSCRRADAHAEVVGSGEAETIAIVEANIAVAAAVIGADVDILRVLAFVFTLILQGEVQTLHQTEEIAVTVGCDAVGAACHKVIRIGVGVAAELRQHIGPAFNVVQHAVVTTVVEGAVIAHFDTGECQTGPRLIAGGLGVVGLNVIFPLAIAGKHIVDLGFAFKAKT